MFLDRFYPPEADHIHPVYCDGNCGTEIVITFAMGLLGPPYLCHECAEIQEEGDEEEMSIGQLVDALREKCREDLGVKVKVRLDTFDAGDHDTAERFAIQMAQELRGVMSGVERPLKGDSPTRWYRVGTPEREIEFVVFWWEKENTAREQAV